MRILLATFVLLSITLGAIALAHGDEAESAEDAIEALQERLDALEAEVKYLRSRELDLTAYLLQNEARAKGLEQVAAASRRAGFEANRIPVDSRRILLNGMENLAKSLRQGLPALSPEQVKLAKQAAQLRR